MKLVYAAIIIAVLSVQLGVSRWILEHYLKDYLRSRIHSSASQPEVIVTKNTFEDIDISIKGITGDKSICFTGSNP